MWDQGASTFVQDVDKAFWFIFGVSAFFLAGIVLAILFCVIRFSKKRNPEPKQIHGSILLEFIWTAIPTALVLVMFYYGWQGYIKMNTIPEDAIEMEAVGGMWWWKFNYPNGLSQGNDEGMTVPVNTPIKVTLRSQDVVHAFYVPAFRVKMDVMPKADGARLNTIWFEATKEGSFDLFCAEYCGLDHAQMLSKVHVVSKEKYEQFLVDAKKKAEADLAKNPGAVAYKAKGCFACHSVDGSKSLGPSFKGLYGKDEVVVTDGAERTVTVDEAYLADSIRNPNNDVVKGYQPIMPPHGPALVSDEEMQAIINYIKKLK